MENNASLKLQESQSDTYFGTGEYVYLSLVAIQLTCISSMMYICQYYFLFEFASGYALFEVHGMHKFHDEWLKVYDHFTEFEVAEKYINSNPFILIAFYPFSSPADALIQMKAICNCE